MTMARVRHVHLSTRYDRPSTRLALFLRVWTTRASLLTLTEVGGRRDVLKLPGWTTLQAPRGSARGADESAILVRDRTWTIRTWWTEQLSEIPVGSRGGATVHAVFGLLEHRTGPVLLASAGHLPSGVQDGDGFADSKKVQTWKESLQWWARVVLQSGAYSPDAFLVAADWNVDHRRHPWRAYIGSRFPMLHCTWTDRLPKGAGTHGNRVIDATWTTLRVRRIRLLRGWRRVSDHRGYVETLTL